MNGYSIEERREIFYNLLRNNEEKELKQYVNIYSDEKNIREKILAQKENFIEVIKYDL